MSNIPSADVDAISTFGYAMALAGVEGLLSPSMLGGAGVDHGDALEILLEMNARDVRSELEAVALRGPEGVRQLNRRQRAMVGLTNGMRQRAHALAMWLAGQHLSQKHSSWMMALPLLPVLTCRMPQDPNHTSQLTMMWHPGSGDSGPPAKPRTLVPQSALS